MKSFEYNKDWKNLSISLYEENETFELFHENSKITKYTQFPPTELVLDKMQRMYPNLTYDQFPETKLDEPLKKLKLDLPTSILSRKSPVNTAVHNSPNESMDSSMEAENKKDTSVDKNLLQIKFKELSTVLYYAYGVNRLNEDNDFPRPFRVVPSGGALYPLEIYFYANNIENIEPALYHYNPTNSAIYKIPHNEAVKLSEIFVDFQSNLANESSMIIFITAVFERSAMKYKSRGYRFILLEAGHVAQNINLVSTALGFNILNVGGFYDRIVDKFLDLDGISHSSLYLQSIS